MKIFKDGYLLPEFINPNYRGLVGWQCEVVVKDGVKKGSNFKVLGIRAGSDFFTNMFEESLVHNIKITAFTPADIPIGELCWCWDDVGLLRVIFEEPLLRVFEIEDLEDFKYVVPYLIASTPEEAKERKHWHERG